VHGKNGLAPVEEKLEVRPFLGADRHALP
jgi:hypothetical protein